MKRALVRQRVMTVLTRSIKTEHEGGGTSWRSEPDGTKAAEVVLWIDLDRLVQYLGAKAIRSKSGRSVIQSGMIEVVVDKKTIQREGAWTEPAPFVGAFTESHAAPIDWDKGDPKPEGAE